jgi:hypothetical protein
LPVTGFGAPGCRDDQRAARGRDVCSRCLTVSWIQQEHRHRLRDIAVRPDHTVRLTVIARGHQPARSRHHEPGQVAFLFIPRFDHADKLARLTENAP